MTNIVFPTGTSTKANPVDADILLIADSEDNNALKDITIGSITADIADGIINDSSASSTTTYSSTKINTQITAATPDSTTSVKGLVKMSTAPASATSPIAVGDNDPRVPTQGENDALVGTSGTPGSSNKYVTNDDTGAKKSNRYSISKFNGRFIKNRLRYFMKLLNGY